MTWVRISRIKVSFQLSFKVFNKILCNCTESEFKGAVEGRKILHVLLSWFSSVGLTATIQDDCRIMWIVADMHRSTSTEEWVHEDICKQAYRVWSWHGQASGVSAAVIAWYWRQRKSFHALTCLMGLISELLTLSSLSQCGNQWHTSSWQLLLIQDATHSMQIYIWSIRPATLFLSNVVSMIFVYFSSPRGACAPRSPVTE